MVARFPAYHYYILYFVFQPKGINYKKLLYLLNLSKILYTIITVSFMSEAAMPLYLSIDGGGSKCCAILYDENGPLGYGRAEGTNTTLTSMEDCRDNIAQCIDQVLAGHPAPMICRAHAVLVGPDEVLEEVLASRADIGQLTHIGEGLAGLLAGALCQSGIVALSGTGSDVFYLSADGECHTVGGLGSILGDQGGGVWIGQCALRAALAYQEGFGEETMLLSLLQEEWGVTDKWAFVKGIYGEKSPFRKVASFVPVVAKAARLGDRVALSLFEEAGRLMAAQALALSRRANISKEAIVCVCSGGAWKAHPAMYQAFAKRMAETLPHFIVQKPLFEPVMAGVVANALRECPSRSDHQLRQKLLVPYQQFQVHWQEG